MLALYFPFVGHIGGPRERFPNGYLAWVPRAARASDLGITSGLTSCVLPLVVTSPSLRSIAAGGLAESELGWDVRFETPTAGKLAHQDVGYDPAAGIKAVWLRFPVIASGSLIDLRIYVGKPGLTVSEADPVGCWAGYLAAIDLATGIDHSGNGGDLALSGVGIATLGGLSAGRYDETAPEIDTLVTDTSERLVSSTGDTLVTG